MIIGHAGDARRAPRRHDHRRLPTGVDAGARLGAGDQARAIDRGARPPHRPRRNSRRSSCTIPATPPTRPATSSPGCPTSGVLFTGDLIFNGLTPLVFMGSVGGARRSLEWLASFEPATSCPGTARSSTAAGVADVLDAHDRYYRFVESRRRRGTP